MSTEFPEWYQAELNSNTLSQTIAKLHVIDCREFLLAKRISITNALETMDINAPERKGLLFDLRSVCRVIQMIDELPPYSL